VTDRLPRAFLHLEAVVAAIAAVTLLQRV